MIFRLATKGLKKANDAPDRAVECPGCLKKRDFNTDEIVWDDDGKFEYVDTDCECGHSFQICAIYKGRRYVFFAS